jgi:hypothetical protein
MREISLTQGQVALADKENKYRKQAVRAIRRARAKLARLNGQPA